MCVCETERERERERENLLLVKVGAIFFFYQQLVVPHSVSKRWGHSLSVFIMSPHCVWIITVGGLGDTRTLATFPNIVMLTELSKYKVMSEWFTYS